MPSLRVLGDAAVHDILIGLSRSEILTFKNELGKSLRDFSVAGERAFQPLPAALNRPDGQKTLFRPFTSPTSVGTKIVVDPAPVNGKKDVLHGIIALCDNAGLPTGVINAEEVTGYRTSLCALIPYIWRRHTEKIVVFGAGKQALWHIRLALALRGEEIKEVTFVNRTATRAQTIIKKLQEENQKLWKASAKLESVDATQSDYEQRVESLLSSADAIFCTVPSEKPLFPARYVTKRTGDRQPYISAIGSWQPDMIELEPSIIQQASKAGNASEGALLVDDVEQALHHTGELVQSKLAAEEVTELGTVLGQQKEGKEEEAPSRALAEGFVVYKGIGVSVTDLAAGNAILKFAEKRSLGTVIDDF